MTRARTAAWLLARLVGKYGWEIQHLGEDIAGGGFIANIPGDVQAIFRPPWSTTAPQRPPWPGCCRRSRPARCVCSAHLDYRALWAAGQAGTGRRGHARCCGGSRVLGAGLPARLAAALGCTQRAAVSLPALRGHVGHPLRRAAAAPAPTSPSVGRRGPDAGAPHPGDADGTTRGRRTTVPGVRGHHTSPRSRSKSSTTAPTNTRRPDE